MSNIITLREKLTFGKHAGTTGAQLLKSEEGTNYLVWIYNNTDIQIDANIVNTLASLGLVNLKMQRLNSRNLSMRQVMRDAHAHDKRLQVTEGGNMAEFPGLVQQMGRAVRSGEAKLVIDLAEAQLAGNKLQREALAARQKSLKHIQTMMREIRQGGSLSLREIMGKD